MTCQLSIKQTQMGMIRISSGMNYTLKNRIINSQIWPKQSVLVICFFPHPLALTSKSILHPWPVEADSLGSNHLGSFPGWLWVGLRQQGTPAGDGREKEASLCCPISVSSPVPPCSASCWVSFSPHPQLPLNSDNSSIDVSTCMPPALGMVMPSH